MPEALPCLRFHFAFSTLLDYLSTLQRLSQGHMGQIIHALEEATKVANLPHQTPTQQNNHPEILLVSLFPKNLAWGHAPNLISQGENIPQYPKGKIFSSPQKIFFPLMVEPLSVFSWLVW